MPTRRDIDPTEIARLLPRVALVEVNRDGYRWRLMGTAIVADLGQDLTGRQFGGYVAPPSFAGRMTATFDRVLAEGAPVFEESFYRAGFQVVRAVSRLLLPLALQDGSARMVLLSRVPRGCKAEECGPRHLGGALGQLCGTFQIDSAAELDLRLAAWERRVETAFSPTSSVPQPLFRIANIWGGGPPRMLRCVREAPLATAEVVRLR